MSARRRNWAWLLAPLAILLATTIEVGSGNAADSAAVPGSSGTDTSLPLTPSAVTVNGRGKFADLKITVNQTRDLVNQAISVSWSGGSPTNDAVGRFSSDYLQLMQCWGDDDGTVPDNPGPPPEQCVQGAANAAYGGSGAVMPNLFASERTIRRTSWTDMDQSVGVVDPDLGTVARPFRAVDGTLVTKFYDSDFRPEVVGGDFWLNPYFNIVTTNEIVGAVTKGDGTGGELFEVQTGLESSGLGCGQKSQRTESGGAKTVPRCWLVIVPRGSAEDENVGTPFAQDGSQFGVVTSPLAPYPWSNRIAIPLTVTPLDNSCALGGDERRISGNDLATAAISNWQPALCAQPGLPPYAYAPVGDDTARQQLTSAVAGGPGMVVVNEPLLPASTRGSPVVYAPLTASGLVIGFNIDRIPTVNAPPAEQVLSGVRVAKLNLTPRLVAKLLTQSYLGQVRIVQAPDSYDWVTTNPLDLGSDPDFLQWNPEFSLLRIGYPRTFSGLNLPSGNTDAARQLWKWILADPEAKSWLDGSPDAWGMKVNPYYSTSATVNPLGTTFGDPLPNSYPKSDPYCYQAPTITRVTPPIVPSQLCGTDWMPYSRNLADSARIARVAFDGARIVGNVFATSPSTAWNRDGRQGSGGRSILALTDTASASLFGVQMASLSRAGDNGADRQFVAPTRPSIAAGVDAMKPGSEPSVLEPDHSVLNPGAYPLTMVSYAATLPLRLDDQARAEYAAFLDYAATRGQVSGFARGDLPQGYAPLSEGLKTQLAAAAETVRSLTAPPSTVPTTPDTTVVEQPAEGGSAPISSAVTAGRTSSAARPATSSARPASSAQPPSVETPTSSEVPTTDSVPTTDVIPPAGEESAAQPQAGPSALTPIVSIAGSRLAVPALGGVAIIAALAALELTKRPRRRAASPLIEVEST